MSKFFGYFVNSIVLISLLFAYMETKADEGE